MSIILQSILRSMFAQPNFGGGTSTTYQYHAVLPGIIGKNPTSFVNFVDDWGQRNIIIGSGTGLHLMRMVNDYCGPEYVRTLERGKCADVILMKRPPPGSENGTESANQENRFMVAALFNSIRGKNDTSASIIFINGAALESMNVSAAQLTCDQAWGRVRKMAFSYALDRIFITTTTEHQLAGVHQSGAIWTIPVTNSFDSTYPPCSMAFRIAEKKPGDFRHLAINDELRLLAVSDRNDGVQHSVNVYDAVSGTYLYDVSTGNADAGLRCGSVFYPLGLAFDGDILYVADESGRIQRFNMREKRCEAVVYETPYNSPESISIDEDFLIILGSQHGRTKKWSSGSFLTLYKL